MYIHMGNQILTFVPCSRYSVGVLLLLSFAPVDMISEVESEKKAPKHALAQCESHGDIHDNILRTIPIKDLLAETRIGRPTASDVLNYEGNYFSEQAETPLFWEPERSTQSMQSGHLVEVTHVAYRDPPPCQIHAVYIYARRILRQGGRARMHR